MLAYTGGLDTSVAVPWLAEAYGADVITLTLDLGQSRELDAIRERALAAGAVNAHVLDAREEFVALHVLPALQAGAFDEGRGPLATALGRPLIARKLVDIARIEGATAIAHLCADEGLDRLRIEASARALDPAIRILAPAREWGMTRPARIEYARQHGIPVSVGQANSCRIDANLWGRSIEGGALDDTSVEPPADVFTLTADPASCPDEPACLDVEFLRGVPVAVNNVPMPVLEIIGSLGTIAGHHGVGRIDAIESRPAGLLARSVHEAPASVVLHAAHRELERCVMPRDLERVKRDLGFTYADLIDQGRWFSPLRGAIDAFVADVQQRVTGTIRLQLLRGSCRVVGRSTALSPGKPAPASSLITIVSVPAAAALPTPGAAAEHTTQSQVPR